MDYVALVMFAIQAAMRLGQKLQTVFEEETRDNPLILPPVEGTQLPTFDEVEPFFEGDGKAFVAGPGDKGPDGNPLPPGLYADIWRKRNDPAAGGAARDKLIEAYARIRHLNETNAADTRGSFRGDSASFLNATNALFVVKQWRENEDPKRPPIQRIAGTIVDIALDYVKTDPRLFGGTGRGDRLTRAFLLSLDTIDFAETDVDDLLVDVFEASLGTVADNSNLLLGEQHWQLLLKNVSLTLVADFKKASGDGNKLRALYRFRREVLQDVIKTGAAVVGENADRFLGPAPGGTEALFQAVLKGLLSSLQQEPDLFTTRAAADLFSASMNAVAQNARLVLPATATSAREAFLAELMTGIAKSLAASAAATPPGLFTPDLLTDLASTALEITAANAARLITPSDPRQQLLADSLQALTAGFAVSLRQSDSAAAALRSTLSREHLIGLARTAFAAVAQNPTELLGLNAANRSQSALAQIAAAIAQAIAADPAHLVNGEGCVQLFRVALDAFARNPDRLLGLDGTGPGQVILTRVLTSVVAAAAKSLQAGGRNLLTGPALLELIEIALATVSANVDGFVKEPAIVSMVTDRLLHAASSTLKNELDANSLLRVFGPILFQALVDRKVLDASDAQLVLPLLKAAA